MFTQPTSPSAHGTMRSSQLGRRGHPPAQRCPGNQTGGIGAPDEPLGTGSPTVSRGPRPAPARSNGAQRPHDVAEPPGTSIRPARPPPTDGSARKAARNSDEEAEPEATAAATAAAPAGVAEPESEGGNSVLSLAVVHNSGVDLVYSVAAQLERWQDLLS